MADGVEHLLVDIEAQAVEELLQSDGRIVAVETCTVILLLLSAPTVRPAVWQFGLTYCHYSIHHRVNGQLQNGRAIATLRCTPTMVDCSRLANRITIENVVLSLENVFADDAVVRLVDGKDEGCDGITSVDGSCRIFIYTRLTEVIALERITCTFTYSCVYRIEDWFQHVELDTPERALAIDIGGVIVIETGAVQ